MNDCVGCGRPGEERQVNAYETAVICEACLATAKVDIMETWA